MLDDFGRIEQRLDRIEGKLDNHLERVAKVEEAVEGMRGHIRLILSAITAVVTTGIMVLVQLIKGRM